MARRCSLAVAFLMAVGLAAVATPGPADDDLAVIKRAVAAPGRQAPRRGEARWLRLRIDEKDGSKHVSVNLPLALVRALGDELPLGWRCHTESADKRCKLSVSEALEALESGQHLVEVEDETATVRIWVD